MLTEIAVPIIADGVDQLRQQLIAGQRAKGLRDRGGSADSLRVEIISDDTSVSGQLYGFERWKIQQNGRGPNRSGQPSPDMIEQIREWVKRHGIEESAAYPIAAKIAREGIKVPNPNNPGGVLSDVLNTDNVRNLISPRLRGAIRQELKSTLFNIK